MAEHVDEAGATTRPVASIESRAAPRSLPDIRDPVTTDRDVRGKRGRTGSVDDAAAADQEIVRGHALTFAGAFEGKSVTRRAMPDGRSHAPTIIGVRIAANVIHLLLNAGVSWDHEAERKVRIVESRIQVRVLERQIMIGKYPILVILAAAVGVAACSTGQEEVDNNPDAREAEATADAAGESRVEMTEQHQSWRAATNPGRQRTQRRGDRPRRRGGDYRPHRSGQRRAGRDVFVAHPPWRVVTLSRSSDPRTRIPRSRSGMAAWATRWRRSGETLDPDGDYIVNVHQSPTQLDTIVSCGELVKSSSPEY